jgi:hypothetical protein
LVEPAQIPPEDPDATLRPPQFTLRTLLVAITLLACAFAVMTAIGSVWTLAILLFAALVAGHVVGNALGTTLRDRSARRKVDEREVAVRAGPRLEIVSPSRLTVPARLHWITMVMAAGGALAGGYFGGAALAASYPEATTAAVVLGFASSGVLGGLAGFAASSFVSVVQQALREAHAGGDHAKPRPTPRLPE